jgi:UDP-3-O-[3-hydroxymyristoyl] N-acetylglucosamine deacetylase
MEGKMTRHTLTREVDAEGIALHAGTWVRMALRPAEPHSGIVFHRADLGGRTIPARYDRVSETRLGTVISDADGATVGVIEHLMAAIAGAELDDMEVILDGPEPPILDGDALSYLKLIQQGELTASGAPREMLQVLRRVEARTGEAWAALSPSQAREFDFEIDFPTPAIGKQSFFWTFSPEGFVRDIAPARTFGFVHELEALHRAGLGRGASLNNTLAIEGDSILNRHLMRFPDEFVRHKILDAIGDLALAGAPILGRFEGYHSGHTLNKQLLRAFFADPSNYSRIPCC